MKILLAADGSEHTRKAAQEVVRLARALKEAPSIRVHFVCPPLPYPSAAAVVGTKVVEGYQREQAGEALEVAQQAFKDAGLACEVTYTVGDVAKEIVALIGREKVDLLVVGSRGHGALANIALGSVATKLLAAAPVPVLVVR